jgi:hypothetical protein
MEPVKDTYRGGDDLINMYSIYGIKMT